MLFNSIGSCSVDKKGQGNIGRSLVNILVHYYVDVTFLHKPPHIVEVFNYFFIRLLYLWGRLIIVLMFRLTITNTSFASNKK